MFFLYSTIPNCITLKVNLQTGECLIHSINKNNNKNFDYYSNIDIYKNIYLHVSHKLGVISVGKLHCGTQTCKLNNELYICFLNIKSTSFNVINYYTVPALYRIKNNNLFVYKISKYPILNSFIARHTKFNIMYANSLFVDDTNLYLTLNINDCDTYTIEIDKNKFLSTIDWFEF